MIGSTESIPDRAEFVVIGVGGASVALHLAKLGRGDVVVLDRHGLGEGTTWHSAGFVGQLRSTISQTRTIMYSTELYRELGAETGLDPGWRGVGGSRSTTPGVSGSAAEGDLRSRARACSRGAGGVS